MEDAAGPLVAELDSAAPPHALGLVSPAFLRFTDMSQLRDKGLGVLRRMGCSAECILRIVFL